MKPWCTVLLALSLLGAPLRPHLFPQPWLQMDSAFQVPHLMFWPVLALSFVLAGVPVELRLGRLALLAGWTLPLLTQRWMNLPPSPLLGALSLVVMLLVASHRAGEPLPRKSWAAMAILQLFSLWLLAPSAPALLASAGCGALLAWQAKSETVAILGLASAMAWTLLWLC